jgi:hypothetical protein
MSQLKNAGLVVAEKEGINVKYTVNPAKQTTISLIFESIGYPKV